MIFKANHRPADWIFRQRIITNFQQITSHLITFTNCGHCGGKRCLGSHPCAGHMTFGRRTPAAPPGVAHPSCWPPPSARQRHPPAGRGGCVLRGRPRAAPPAGAEGERPRWTKLISGRAGREGGGGRVGGDGWRRVETENPLLSLSFPPDWRGWFSLIFLFNYGLFTFSEMAPWEPLMARGACAIAPFPGTWWTLCGIYCYCLHFCGWIFAEAALGSFMNARDLLLILFSYHLRLVWIFS